MQQHERLSCERDRRNAAGKRYRLGSVQRGPSFLEQTPCGQQELFQAPFYFSIYKKLWSERCCAAFFTVTYFLSLIECDV
jgi:hypothetical protein